MSDLNLLNNLSFGKRMKPSAYNKWTTDKMTPLKHFCCINIRKNNLRNVNHMSKSRFPSSATSSRETCPSPLTN